MSDDCFFNPAACEDAATDGGAEMTEVDADWAETEAWVEENSGELFNAQLAFLLTSGLVAAQAGLELFRYKWAIECDGTDADGDAEDQVCYFSTDYTLRNAEYIDTMYWMQGDQIKTWGTFLIMGTAHVFQILSMLGMMTSLNLMVWGWGVGVGGMVVHALVAYYWLSGMNAGWAACTTAYETPDDTDSDEVTECTWMSAYFEIIEAEMMKAMAKDTAITLTLGEYYEMWVIAQWWAMPEEERYAMWLEKKDDDEMFAKLF